MPFNRVIPRHPGSYAILSETEDTRGAVVFVHGFGGDARTTWLDFQQLICQDDPWWRRRDAYFWDYGSVGSQTYVQGTKLLSFVDYIFPSPPSELFRISATEVPWLTVPIPPTVNLPVRTYSDLTLVGHSEGGVIVRRAVLIRAKQREATAQPDSLKFAMMNADLALFAPAQLGASLSKWHGFYLNLPFFRQAIAPFLNISPAYLDLQQGSAALLTLRLQTDDLAGKHPTWRGLRARSAFGENENVVVIGEYRWDPPVEVILGRNHQNICTPESTYLSPLAFVAGQFSEGMYGV